MAVIQSNESESPDRADDTDDVKLDKLEALLARGLPDAKVVAPLFAPLLSIPLEDRYPPLEMTPERQKEQTLEALVGQMERPRSRCSSSSKTCIGRTRHPIELREG